MTTLYYKKEHRFIICEVIKVLQTITIVDEMGKRKILSNKFIIQT